jgi:hypothetical protein
MMWICYRHKQPLPDIDKYVDKISSAEDKCDIYIETQQWRKAYDIAAKAKDSSRLQEIFRQCKDPALERQINELMSRL